MSTSQGDASGTVFVIIVFVIASAFYGFGYPKYLLAIPAYLVSEEWSDQLIRSAANSGVPGAQYDLALKMSRTEQKGGDPDINYLLRQAAEGDDDRAKAFLGHRLYSGEGGEQNKIQGLQLMRDSVSEEGTESSYNYLAYYLDKEGNKKESIEYYEKAAKLNSSTAHHNLFWAFVDPEDRDIRDKSKALYHLRRSADLNDRNALKISLDLDLYDDKIGFNKFQGRDILEFLTEDCNSRVNEMTSVAQDSCYSIFFFSEKLKISDQEGIDALKRGAEKNSLMSKIGLLDYRLSTARRGEVISGVEMEIEDILAEWIPASFRSNLGVYLFLGQGVTRNQDQGKNQIQRAAKMGSAIAKQMITDLDSWSGTKQLVTQKIFPLAVGNYVSL